MRKLTALIIAVLAMVVFATGWMISEKVSNSSLFMSDEQLFESLWDKGIVDDCMESKASEMQSLYDSLVD